MCLPAWYHPIAIVLLVVFNNIADAEYEGDPCNNALEGRSGICKKLTQCVGAMHNLMLGMNPQNCGFVSTMPIVCCTAEPTSARTIPATLTKTVPITTTTRTVPIKEAGIGQLAVGEKSRLACERYKMLAYKKINSSFDGESELIENCPWEHRNVGTAVQGTIAEQGEFPHMVLIDDTDDADKYWYCSGSLISEKFVLTSGLCVIFIYTFKTEVAHLGDINYADPDNDQYVQEIKIKGVHWPNNYNFDSAENDIGLIEFERPAHLNLHVKPICLYRWKTASKVRSAIVAGWGSASKIRKNSKLLKGVVQHFSDELCEAQYLQDIGGRFDSEKISCFGRKNDNHTDVCADDIGVPLQIYNKDVYCSYYVFAVARFSGRKNCDENNLPTMFTNVYPYLAWIESIVWP